MFKDALAEVPYEKSILLYKENGKYGIISFEGKQITKPIYDSIESLLYREGCLIVKQNEKYGVINIKGQEVIEAQYDSISADGYYEEETKYKNAGFIIGTKGEEGYRYGYINSEGKEILSVEYNQIERITEIPAKNQIYLLALKNGQAGVYKNNNLIIKHSYEEIEYNRQNELFVVRKANKQGVFGKNGEEILKLEYDNISISQNNIKAQKDGNTYYFNNNGESIESSKQENVQEIENSNYIIIKNDQEQYGIKNKEGNILLAVEYLYIEHAYKNYFIISKDGKTSVFDANKRQEIISNYNVVQKINNKNALQAIKENNNTEIYNENLEKTATMENAILINDKDYIKLYSKTERKYFDENGNEIANTKAFPSIELYAFKQEDGKWGYKDRFGNIKIQAIYDMATELNNYGFAGIRKDDKWGVINAKGEILVEPEYEIEVDEPDFIGPYCRINFGYGMVYYTKNLK